MKTIKQISKGQIGCIKSKELGLKVVTYRINQSSDCELHLLTTNPYMRIFKGRWAYSDKELSHRDAVIQLLTILYADQMKQLQEEEEEVEDAHLLPLDCWLDEHWGIELTEDESHEYL